MHNSAIIKQYPYICQWRYINWFGRIFDYCPEINCTARNIWISWISFVSLLFQMKNQICQRFFLLCSCLLEHVQRHQKLYREQNVVFVCFANNFWFEITYWLLHSQPPNLLFPESHIYISCWVHTHTSLSPPFSTCTYCKCVCVCGIASAAIHELLLLFVS